MKCNKCGEECKENQAFCLKCGNPIQVVPDFNLIEAELASNIGELMDEIDHEEKPGEDIDDIDIKEVQINDMELKLVDISRHSQDNGADGRTKIIGDISHMIRDEIPEEQEISGQSSDSIDRESQNDNKKPIKNSKKKIAIISAVVVLVLALAVGIFIIVAKSVERTATSYEEYYNMAAGAYEKLNTDSALENAELALSKASNNSEKLKARELIYNIHVLSGEKGQDYCDNLEGIIELGTQNAEYYSALAKYYDENEKYTNLTELIRGVDDEIILSSLEEYIVKEPSADFQSGDYTSYMAVTLTADEGYTIYYTTDSRNPSNYGEKYSEPIQITKEGESIIKAIAVNEKGVESKIVTFTYNITLSGSNAPVITPSGGAYSEYTKIKVEVPEGGKAYYTWDGTDPTEQSQEYTQEIDMKRGINILKVIVIDKYGIASDIAQQSYNLQIPRVLSLNDAVKLIEEEAGKSLEEGDSASVSYDNTVVIDNDEYYIIYAAVSDSEGNEKSMTIYAVNTYDKSIKKAIDENGQYVIDGVEGETAEAGSN